MVKDLTIVIKGNSEGALTALRAVKSELTEIARLAGEVGKIKFGVGGAGSGATGGFGEQIKKDAEEAGASIDKTRGKIKKLFEAFGASSGMGQAFIPKTILKDLESEINKLSKSALKGEEGANAELLKEAEQYHQKRKALAHSLTVDQIKDAEVSAKKALELQREENKEKLKLEKQFQSGSSGYWMQEKSWTSEQDKAKFKEQIALGEEYVATRKRWVSENIQMGDALKANEKETSRTISEERRGQEALGASIAAEKKRALENILDHSKGLDINTAATNKNVGAAKQSMSVLREISRIQGEAVKLVDIGKAMGDPWVIKPGMSDERISLISKDISRVVALRAKIEHETAKALAAGQKLKIYTLSDIQKYNEKEQASWSQGVSGVSHKGLGLSQSEFELLSKFHHLFPEVTKDMIAYKTQLGRFVGDIGSFMSMQVRWFASAGIIFAGLAAIRTGATAFLAFDKALKDIGAVTGATNEELALLAERALKVSLVVPYSATELANLAKAMVQAGLSAEQTAGIMEDVAKVATVSGATLQEVGNAYATAIFAFQMSVEESKKIGNTLAATINYSRLSLGDLQIAFSYTAAVAHGFNLSFQELNATLAVFSNVGIRVSTLSTGFATLLSRLVDPPKEFRAEIEKSGRSYRDFMKILESQSPDKFADILKFLESIGYGGAKALQHLGERAGRELSASINVGSKAFYEMGQRIRETTQLSEGYETAMSSLSNQLAAFKNHLLAIAINLGDNLKPLMQSMISTLTFVGKTLFYVTEGLKVFGDHAVLATVGVATLVVLVLKFAGAITTLTAVLQVSRLALVSHPIFAGIIVTGALLSFLGWLSTTGDEMEDFDKKTKGFTSALDSQRDAARTTKKVFDDSAGSAKTLKARIDEWVNAMRVKTDMPILSQLEVLTDNATIALNRMRELEAQIIQTTQAQLSGYEKLPQLEEQLAALTKARDYAERVTPLFGRDEHKKKISDMNYQIAALTWRLNGLKTFLAGAQGNKITDILGNQEELEKFNLSLKKAYDRVSKGGLASEAMRRALNISEIGEAEKILEKFDYLQKEVKSKEDAFKKAYKEYFDASGEDKEKKMEGASEALTRLNLEELKVFATSAEIGNAMKKWKEEAQSAQLSLEGARDEVTKIEYELKTAVSNDPFLKLEQDFANKISGIKKRIDELKIDIIPDLEKEISSALAKDTRKLSKDQKDVVAQLLESKQKSLEASREELKEEEKKLGLYREQNSVLERQAALQTLSSTVDFKESFLGADLTAERQLLDLYSKMVEAKGVIPEGTINSTTAVWERMILIGSGLQPLSDDLAGMFDVFTLGAAEASRGMTNMFSLILQAGKEVTSTLQGAFSDFFSGVATGYGEWHDSLDDSLKEKLSGWEGYVEFLKDQVDSFMKGVYEGFMKTMADIWSNMLVGGIIDYLKEFASIREGLNYIDQQAIGKQTTLTGIMATQIPVVQALTTVYWELAAAKAAAGFSSGVAGATGNTGGSGFVSPTAFAHTGGYISTSGLKRYHVGGLSSDEKLKILQVGEFVVSRKGVKAVGLDALHAINQGKTSTARTASSSQPAVTNVIINAIDSKSFSDYVKKNPSAILGVVSKDLSRAGGTRTAIRSYL